MDSKELPPQRESREEYIRSLYGEAKNRLGLVKLAESIYVFAHKLQSLHSDYYKHRLYHVLIGSTAPEGENMNENDFEGDDSIEKFLKGLK